MSDVEELLRPLPRFPLVSLPTPLERTPRLGAELGIDLWFKRDDLTGIGCGGNKLRKLEFILGEAIRGGVDTLLTTGGVQSNHARLTAAVAARAGMACELILKGDRPAAAQGNLLLDALFGAEVRICAGMDYPAVYGVLEDRAAKLKAAGRRPMVIPLGGATASGTAGYVAAFAELLAQLEPSGGPLTVALSGGTGSTAAGLALGAALLAPETRLLVISASWSREKLSAEIGRLFEETAALLGVGGVPIGELVIEDGFVGPGYAIPSLPGCAALRLAARLEGVVLDTTYTAKALSGLVASASTRTAPVGSRVVFVHTGGAPELFTHAPEEIGV